MELIYLPTDLVISSTAEYIAPSSGGKFSSKITQKPSSLIFEASDDTNIGYNICYQSLKMNTMNRCIEIGAGDENTDSGVILLSMDGTTINEQGSPSISMVVLTFTTI